MSKILVELCNGYKGVLIDKLLEAMNNLDTYTDENFVFFKESPGLSDELFEANTITYSLCKTLNIPKNKITDVTVEINDILNYLATNLDTINIALDLLYQDDVYYESLSRWEKDEEGLKFVLIKWLTDL